VGSVRGNDLVIMAHNYNSHFGRLSKLSEGDRVTFTDMDGILTTYEVIALDILNPYAVEEVTSGDFDLTLFTCTYGGKSRVTVFCDIVHD
jgi:sortase A